MGTTDQAAHVIVIVAAVSLAGQLGLISWGIWSVRRMIKEEAEAVMSKHNSDQYAHANHPNAQRYREEMGSLGKLVTESITKLAVIDERIRTGQEVGATRWASIEEKLENLTSIERRLAQIEIEHEAIHRLHNGKLPTAGGRS